jgi:hypothetical protein
MEYNVLDVNFERMKLWGLTLYLWLHVCRVIQYRLQKDYPDSCQKLDTFIKSCDSYRVKFNWYYLPGLLFKWATEHWHYKNRTMASFYPPQKYSYRGTFASFSLMFVMAAAYWFYLSV